MAINIRIVFKLALKISKKPQSFLKAGRICCNYAVGSPVKIWRAGDFSPGGWSAPQWDWLANRIGLKASVLQPPL
ncbi:MAG: hypothetical protein H0X14_03340 [Acidobacteria bacterium]|nr:hypothetical protein [Acidobacteriota bacterium]